MGLSPASQVKKILKPALDKLSKKVGKRDHVVIDSLQFNLINCSFSPIK